MINGHGATNEVCARVSTVFQLFVKFISKKIKEQEIKNGYSMVQFAELNKGENEIFNTIINSFSELKELYPNMITINNTIEGCESNE